MLLRTEVTRRSILSERVDGEDRPCSPKRNKPGDSEKITVISPTLFLLLGALFLDWKVLYFQILKSVDTLNVSAFIEG